VLALGGDLVSDEADDSDRGNSHKWQIAITTARPAVLVVARSSTVGRARFGSNGKHPG
jgi:hypothetical protein